MTAENHSQAALDATTQEGHRLSRELEQFAQPVGVRPAVLILAAFSVLGIVAPLLLMAYGPAQVDGWLAGLLMVGFSAGLSAVLIYIWWYQRLVSGRLSASTDTSAPPVVGRV